MALFNVRVYGILIDSNKRLLVSDEFIRGNYFTKFPGGGLEFGEGTRDCLKENLKKKLAWMLPLAITFIPPTFSRSQLLIM